MNNFKKGPIIVWLVVIIVVLVAVVGFFVITKNQNVTGKQGSDTVSVVSEPITSPPTVASATINWKSYTSTKYGYTVQYPNDWVIKEDPAEGSYAFIMPSKFTDRHISQTPSVSLEVVSPGSNCEIHDWDSTIVSDAQLKKICLTQGSLKFGVWMRAKTDYDKKLVAQISATFKLSQTPIVNSAGLVVVSPNGGEKIPYTDIVMAGDLSFTWKSQNENYVPTNKFAAYLIDENNLIVRSDFIEHVNSVGDGSFFSSFAGEKNIKTNTNYKIRVCDEVATGVTQCDESDNYFIVK